MNPESAYARFPFPSVPINPLAGADVVGVGEGEVVGEVDGEEVGIGVGDGLMSTRMLTDVVASR